MATLVCTVPNLADLHMHEQQVGPTVVRICDPFQIGPSYRMHLASKSWLFVPDVNTSDLVLANISVGPKIICTITLSQKRLI